MLGRDPRIRAAGGDIHTGLVAVAEHPVVCRQCRDTTEATRDDTVEVGSVWSADDGGEPTPPAMSVAPCRSASVCLPQTWCHLLSPSTQFAGIWPAFRDDLSAINLHRQPWKS